MENRPEWFCLWAGITYFIIIILDNTKTWEPEDNFVDEATKVQTKVFRDFNRQHARPKPPKKKALETSKVRKEQPQKPPGKKRRNSTTNEEGPSKKKPKSRNTRLTK